MEVEIDEEDLCKYCEDHILGCSAITSTFLCEGRYCESAKESYIEYLEENKTIDDYSIV